MDGLNMYDRFSHDQKQLNNIIQKGADSVISDLDMLALELKEFIVSDKRKDMIKGEEYYEGEQDIFDKKRLMISEDGSLQPVKNLPNNKIIDNQYARAVDTKVNYLLSSPPTFRSDDDTYNDHLSDIFGMKSFRRIRALGEGSLNGGLGWLYPYIDEQGEFKLMRFDSSEVMPLWADSEHTILDGCVRVFNVKRYEGHKKVTDTLADRLADDGIYHYVFNDGVLIPDVSRGVDNSGFSPYVSINGFQYGWGRVPLIVFKLNPKEIPLIRRIKQLQDGINTILSMFADNMQEDSHTTVLVLTNLDGTDLGEFRRNLATYNAVKVRSDGSGKGGGVDTLHIEVNAENYKTILKLFKAALIENARSYDSKDERLSSGTPNQMNIQSMYSDIDLDASEMEAEYQASLKDLLYFVDAYLEAKGVGSFYDTPVEITFNRDMPVSTSETIEQAKNSVGIISNETILANHPWVTNVTEELERLEKERSEKDPYEEAFLARKLEKPEEDE